jgi:crotonobetainyl-CoA:carnitine CoA-transferase CaiB-like acyl-CoA transferase
VVDFGHYIAGPLAALLLAEAGAEVIHVDAPSDALEPNPLDPWLNRSKRRITLDLKAVDDLAIAQELIGRADVVIENFRPGVMDRLGLGAEAMRAADPTLIYCSLPGFAAEDVKAQLQGWEGIVQTTVAGYRSLEEHWDPTGRFNVRVEDPSAPLFTPITTASNFGGLLGATTAVIALLARARTGEGQLLEIPLSEAYAEAYSTMLGHRVYRTGNALMGDGLMVGNLTYRCSDGGLIDLSPYAKFIIGLLKEAGVAEEWEKEGLIDVEARTFDLPRRDEIIERFTALVATRPAQWWDEAATRQLSPVSMVRTPAQWLATEQASASGAVISLDDPVLGEIQLLGRSFEMSGDLPPLTPRHLPDADREAILDELRQPRPDKQLISHEPKRLTLPLEGYRIVDISQAVAAPTAARLLADYGAEVVKIGSTIPAVTDSIVGQLHRGKRTMLLNLWSDEGQELMGDFFEDADAFITNLTWDARERFDLSYERAHELNPDLVYCAVSAYGQSGPWARRRGYENQCNAGTGMSSRYGERFGWTLYQPTPVIDADTGILAAFGVVAGLYGRLHGTGGAMVASSLAQGSMLHQGAHLTIEAQHGGHGPDDLRNEYGLHALYRFYKTADRWLFVAGRPGDLDALAALAGADDAAKATWTDPAGALSLALAAHLSSLSAEAARQALAEHGVTATFAGSIDDAVDYLASRDVVYFEPGVEGDAVSRPGVGHWMSATPPRVGENPGAIGTQVLDILADLGLSDEAVAEMADQQVICLPDALPTIDRWT